MSDDDALFPGYDDVPEPLSADQRRTKRQHEQVAAGRHPLTGGPIHPLASRHRDPTAPKTDPFTCGSCWFRSSTAWRAGVYPKCWADDGRRATHSATTDVRAWWPACPSYTPGDTGLGPDAARSIPVENPT